VGWNFALQRAVSWAAKLAKPLLIFEPLRLDYPWASYRLHRFVLDGMAEPEHEAALRGTGVGYYPLDGRDPNSYNGTSGVWVDSRPGASGPCSAKFVT